MSEEKGLIKVESLVIEDVFKTGGTKIIIEAIKKKVAEEIVKHDVTTPKGRKDLRSLAAKVVKSKTFLDGSGKNLKEKHMIIVKPIDSERKIARDTLDLLRDEIKEPVEKFEAELAQKEEEELLQKEYSESWETAHAFGAIFDQELKLKFEKEYSDAWETAHDNNELFDLRKDKEKKDAEDKAAQAEKERLENESRIKKEAEEKATKDAEEKIFFEQQEKARLINEASDRENKIKIDAGNARVHMLKEINIILDFESCKNMDEAVWVEFYDSKNKIFVKEKQDKWVADQKEEQRLKSEEDEKNRLQAIEDAKVKAKKEQDEALEAQRKEQEEKDRIEKKRIADEKEIADRKAANMNHQKGVNRKVVAKLMAIDMGVLPTITEAMSLKIASDIIKSPIPQITINYGSY